MNEKAGSKRNMLCDPYRLKKKKKDEWLSGIEDGVRQEGGY